MAALEIAWSDAERISPKQSAVVTGTSGDEAAAAAAPKKLDAAKPIVVYVSDGSGGDEEKKLQDVTFKAEKVALGMKAFRTVRMTAEQAAADPLLAEKGKEGTRLLVINPLDRKVTVLEKSKLSAAAVFSALEDVSNKFYVEKLDKTVKTHLDLLCEQDQLANKERKLSDDLAREGEKKDDAKAKKEMEEIRADLGKVRKSMGEVGTKQRDLWKLTPKNKAEAA
jgi:hypothetical protein